ncbi:hypothetical protein Tco_0847801 [Tanacetum coccineum]
MSTSNVHQQSLHDASFETRPLMLERGSYIPWTSRFRSYLNRKRETRKWLNKAINEGPYEFRMFTSSETDEPKMQTEEDLRRDNLKYYEVEIKAMNLILISNPNDIYNSVDRETHFNNEFDQFVAEAGESLLLTEDSYDDLFGYLQQFEKLVNASKAKKLEKSHDPLAYFAFGGHLEELHITWAHLEKKRTRYRPTPTSLKIMFSAVGDGITDTTLRRHNEDKDSVTRFHDGVRAHDPAHYLEYSLS